MSNRVRAVTIIICTLLLGVAIGTLIVGPILARHHFRRVAGMRTPKGFASRLEEVIDPDPGQAEAVRGILNRYGESLHEIASRHRSETKAVFDSMAAELEPILTDEQRDRLNRRKHHPGPIPGDKRGTRPRPVPEGE